MPSYRRVFLVHFLAAFMLGDARTESAAPVLHPGRRVSSAQPEPIHRPTMHPSQCWVLVAHVEKKMTGKATGWTRETKKLTAATKDAVLLKRAEFFHEFLHAPQMAPAKRLAAEAAAPVAQRARRSSAPLDLAEGYPDHNFGRRGPLPGEGRAGPGRGRTLERTTPLSIAASSTLLLPPAGEDATNWLVQHSRKKLWQTAYIVQLEKALDDATKLNTMQARCVASRHAVHNVAL